MFKALVRGDEQGMVARVSTQVQRFGIRLHHSLAAKRAMQRLLVAVQLHPLYFVGSFHVVYSVPQRRQFPIAT